MALLPSSSSSTRGRGFNYGVFLSCGTEDTLEFTGLLYQALCNKGIRTFTDCEVVDEITPALEEAIQTSRIAIVGLSKNYASSSFCLDKLSKILDHFNSKVHPVFYQVDPDDVQMLRGTYGEAIAMHKKRFNDRIQKWTMALQQVSNLPGWQFGLGEPIKLKSYAWIYPQLKKKKIDWNGDGFKNMGNLKTLIIKNANFSQAPRHLPSSLRVLEWQRYPSQYLPPNFHPENLAICKLPKRCFRSSDIGGLLNKPVNLDDLSFDNGEHSNEMFYVSCLPKSEEMNVMVSY
ncbi:disease resistance protein RUN1-like isoform X5 [Lotus japonicus]|uniref:disease resistance protein RUN1-like isoform X5 n=1 Tax=Lotus japonicus TaxID=34305 RepID=UPI002584688C|nr:disease resistance protein RUN1-like isoform X5 [Lotus japonicus]